MPSVFQVFAGVLASLAIGGVGLAGLLTLLIAFEDQPEGVDRKKKWRRIALIACAAFMVGAIAAGVLEAIKFQNEPPQEEPPRPTTSAVATHPTVSWSVEPPSSQSPTPTGTATPSTDTSTSPAPEPSGESPLPQAPLYLSDVFAVDNQYVFEVGEYKINKKKYSHSVLLCSNYVTSCKIREGWAEYNVPDGYTKFVATVGVADISDSDCEAQAVVFLDGEDKFTKDMRPGQDEEIELAVSDIFRMRLQMDITNDSEVCYIAFGNAALLRQ